MRRMVRERRWELVLDVKRDSDLPPYLQLARAVVADIHRGRLRPGDQLPGSRRLAVTVGVHRNTVLAALSELAVEGWVESLPRRGVFISNSILPHHIRVSRESRENALSKNHFKLAAVPPAYRPPTLPRGTLNLSNGAPDVRLVPFKAIGRAYRRELALRGARVLGYGDPEGHPALRSAIATMLSDTRGLALNAEHVLVTRGSQMALNLVARALVQPGDVVAVEQLGYRPAWEALRAAGAKIVPVPVDSDGMDTARLERIVQQARVRAVYVTPHHQYPTTVTLKASRRLALLALARRHGIAIIEDDYDHEFHYDGRPILPLASSADGGNVIYIGTLSKVLAPALRVGYIVAPTPLLENIASLRSLLDIQGDLPTEAAIAGLIEDGELQRHIARVRRVYAHRREVLIKSLRTTFGDGLEFTPAAGGMALWVRIRLRVDVETWAQRSVAKGVFWYTGRRYAFDGRPKPFARFTFSWLNDHELAEGVKRMAAALPHKMV